MRHDVTDANRMCIIPLKWFTWGYEFDGGTSRWWLYWIVRFPGRSWQLDLTHSMRMDRRHYCWCRMILAYREHGFWDSSDPDSRNRRYELQYWPIEVIGV